jgi:hypothetical protein
LNVLEKGGGYREKAQISKLMIREAIQGMSDFIFLQAWSSYPLPRPLRGML